MQTVLLALTTTAAWGMSSSALVLDAADGTKVTAELYDAGDKAKPMVLLFHQAGSNLGEYRTIAPRLVRLGFNALAIDQRSGGKRWGRENATVTARGGSAKYAEALPDLEAALKWSRDNGYSGATVAWGSSYSAALVFLLAAKHPGAVSGVVAMSPGEYLRARKGAVAAAAKQIAGRIPVLVVTPPKERAVAKTISEAAGVELHLPSRSVHGSSMLVTEQNPAAADVWPLVERFLTRFQK